MIFPDSNSVRAQPTLIKRSMPMASLQQHYAESYSHREFYASHPAHPPRYLRWTSSSARLSWSPCSDQQAPSLSLQSFPKLLRNRSTTSITLLSRLSRRTLCGNTMPIKVSVHDLQSLAHWFQHATPSLRSFLYTYLPASRYGILPVSPWALAMRKTREKKQCRVRWVRREALKMEPRSSNWGS